MKTLEEKLKFYAPTIKEIEGAIEFLNKVGIPCRFAIFNDANIKEFSITKEYIKALSTLILPCLSEKEIEECQCTITSAPIVESNKTSGPEYMKRAYGVPVDSSW